jgi:hypothetical protein
MRNEIFDARGETRDRQRANARRRIMKDGVRTRILKVKRSDRYKTKGLD